MAIGSSSDKDKVMTESVNLGASKLIKYREAPSSLELTPVPEKAIQTQSSPDQKPISSN